MTRPYSMDLRERVVAAVEAGQSRRAVAKIFNLGPATVVRWVMGWTPPDGICVPRCRILLLNLNTGSEKNVAGQRLAPT